MDVSGGGRTKYAERAVSRAFWWMMKKYWSGRIKNDKVALTRKKSWDLSWRTDVTIFGFRTEARIKPCWGKVSTGRGRCSHQYWRSDSPLSWSSGDAYGHLRVAEFPTFVSLQWTGSVHSFQISPLIGPCSVWRCGETKYSEKLKETGTAAFWVLGRELRNQFHT